MTIKLSDVKSTCTCILKNNGVFIYLLTPWSRVLLDKLTGSAASQEISRFFGTRRFITILTSARHLSLSWANSIQSPQPTPTSWRSILILSSHLRLGLPMVSFPQVSPMVYLQNPFSYTRKNLCTPNTAWNFVSHVNQRREVEVAEKKAFTEGRKK